jgi:murein DD-endopeptidase MepM/ murein hydrolase activator NlpD
MSRSARTAIAALAGIFAVAALSLVPRADAQVPPLDTTTTSATVPPSDSSTTTTAPPAEDHFSGNDSAPAPAGAQSGGDDTAAPSGGKIVVPPGAQAIIDSVKRSRPSNNDHLLQLLQPLEELGLTHEQAIRVGFGRFPIAGPARYSHDWLYPRFGPGFRFHLGNDMFAAYGTPLRAPVDGIVQSGNGSLGGLYVKVIMADRTYFYLAHLSGLVDGFVEGGAVKTGDIVGYVGDSGNARGGAPHLHIEVHPRGGPPIDPKPVMDKFLMEAEARMPQVIAHYRDLASQTAAPQLAASSAARPLLATALLRARVAAASPAPLSTEVLFASAGNPTAGAVELLDAEASSLARSIDWQARADLETARLDLVTRFEASLWTLLDPLLGVPG